MPVKLMRILLVLGAHAAVVSAVSVAATAQQRRNPIRKVVNLLQAMQKKISEEGDRAEDLYQKYMCYCKTSKGNLGGSIDASTEKVPELESSIQAATSKKVQLEADLKAHTADRANAETTLAEATAIRKKEKAAFDKALPETMDELAAVKHAVSAVRKGMAGDSFLQSATAAQLRKLVAAQQDMPTSDYQAVTAFLAGQQGGEYTPSSGDLVGILVSMQDHMSKDQVGLLTAEHASETSYEDLSAAKTKEIDVLTVRIEDKLTRVANLGIEIATMKNDLEDTIEALDEDKRFALNLEKNCAGKSEIHEREKEMRAQEMVAIADTIKVVNNDDSLGLFKKTLPSASSSFLQVQQSSWALRTHARTSLTRVLKHLQPAQRHRIDWVLLALRGKKVGFDKVISLVDNLVHSLKTEQESDDEKKKYCVAQLDVTEDSKKGLERSISDSQTVIEESGQRVSTLTEEVAALKVSITALDKALAEATEDRKAESAEHKELMASHSAAKQLLLFAKNRLNKFYNPRLHKAPPKRDLSEGDRIYEDVSGDTTSRDPGGIAGTGITAFTQMSSRTRREAPAPPPETSEAYKKKGNEAGGVIAMMDLLLTDLDKEMTESEVEEKNGQAEYEQLVSDSAEKRRQDSKSLADKEIAKASFESSLEESRAEIKSTKKEHRGVVRYLAALHSECDWLQQYYSVRQTARTEEIDALEKAKAVLSGADYSLLQRSVTARTKKFLRASS